ncbi:hypothetical protein SY88_17135 [Clostridiales bacterium PH28_bin88]|nr:hypothetical protein SY88_17135 [Clostridiales bacterium PH28_bin88]
MQYSASKRWVVVIAWVLALVVILFWTPTIAKVTYAAVGGKPVFDFPAFSQHYRYVRFLIDRGAVEEYPGGTFKPVQTITRAEAVKMAVMLANLSTRIPDRPTFPDVQPDHRLYPYVETAAAAGLVDGYPDGTFRPQEPLSRAETALLLHRLSGENRSWTGPALTRDVSSWAMASANTFVDAGLLGVDEDGLFHANWGMSRGEFYRVLALLTTISDKWRRVPLKAELVPQQGETYVKRPGGEKEGVTGPVLLEVGDTVVTGGNGRAEIQFEDGTALLLGNGTELEVVKLDGSIFILPDGRAGSAVEGLEINLLRGQVFGGLAPRSLYRGTMSQRVKISMPWGEVGIGGTFWMNQVTPANQITNILSGAAQISAAGGKLDLATGQQARVTAAGVTPAPPTPVPFEEKMAWVVHKAWVLETVRGIKEQAPEMPKALPPVAPLPPGEDKDEAGGAGEPPELPVMPAVQAEVEKPADLLAQLEEVLQQLREMERAVEKATERRAADPDPVIPADITPPGVSFTGPVDNEEGVAVNPIIEVVFGEKVGEGSTYPGIVVKDNNNEAVTVIRSITDNILTLVPVNNLAHGTTYTVTIPAGAVRDLAGNELVGDYTFSFITGPEPDTTPPVVSAGPVGGLYNTELEVILEASEPGAIYYTTDGSDPTTSGTLYTGPINTGETTTMKFMAVDRAGNQSAVYTETYTIDTTPPRVDSTDPAGDEVDVAKDKTITVTFSEEVQAGENFNGITLQAGETVVAATYGLNGNALTINPDSDLDYGTTYTVTIPAGAVQDSAGNALADLYAFSLTTARGQTALTIAGSIPDTVLAGSEVQLEAVLRDSLSEELLGGRQVTFELLTAEGSALTPSVQAAVYTGASGEELGVARANIAVPVDLASGEYLIQAAYVGGADYLGTVSTKTLMVVAPYILKETFDTANYGSNVNVENWAYSLGNQRLQKAGPNVSGLKVYPVHDAPVDISDRVIAFGLNHNYGYEGEALLYRSGLVGSPTEFDASTAQNSIYLKKSPKPGGGWAFYLAKRVDGTETVSLGFMRVVNRVQIVVDKPHNLARLQEVDANGNVLGEITLDITGIPVNQVYPRWTFAIGSTSFTAWLDDIYVKILSIEP